MKLVPALFSLLIVFGGTDCPGKVNLSGRPGLPSMTYFIIPDKETSCSNDFPERFSYFLGQLGGFANKSAASGKMA